MCIAIHKPKGVKLHEFVYRNSFNRNDHGAGMAYVENGKLVIKKGITDVEDFVKMVKEREELEMLIHCRVMSKGEISAANCHPFYAKSGQFPQFEYAVIHNGTLPFRHTEKKSDTACFVDDAIKPLVDRDPWFFSFPLNLAMMGSYIGMSNKMCIMCYNSEKDDITVGIVNDREGIEYKGCWFSNLSFTDDTARWISDADRKRINNWVPKLWVEAPPAPVYHSPSVYGDHSEYDGLPFGSGQGGGWGTGNSPTMPKKDDCWRHGGAFGWYNNHPDYKGRRSLADYNKWKSKQDSAKGTGPAKYGNDDTMEYLDNKELNLARKESVAVLKNLYSDFDFKGMTTIEIAAWARAELRQAFEEFNSLSNKELMRLIISGTIETAPAASNK